MIDVQTFESFASPGGGESDGKREARASKVLVLSNLSEKSTTIPVIVKECKKAGLEVRVIDVGSFSIKPLKKGGFVVDDVEKKPIEVRREDTVVLTRAGVTKNTKTMSLAALLEDDGFFLVNSIQSSTACKNKYITSKILLDNGIPVPRMALVGTAEQIEDAMEEAGGKFPIVAKILSGSHGIGVSIIDSMTSLKSVLQTIWKVDPSTEILLQEKIESTYDLRIHVLTKRLDTPGASEIIGAMQRNRVKKDFRTNYSLGGTVQKVKITDEQKDIAIAAAKAIGCQWCGVDLIVDSKTGKNYVLEINSSPGTKGIMQATGINVVKIIVDFLIDKRNWYRVRRVAAGFRECFEIAGIGKVVGKLDTGNGARSCSLSYDDMEVLDGGKRIKWTIGGRTFTNKVVDTSNAEVGDKVHKRSVIELDVTLGKKTYRKVRVSLTDRKEKSTPFLVNRKMLMEMGCTVDPTRAFVLTTPPDGYDPMEAKGDPHGGIQFKEEDVR